MEYKVVGISLFLIAFFTLIGGCIGFLLFGLLGLVVAGCALFGISAFFVAFVWVKAPSIILGYYNAKPSENETLDKIVERMAINAKIPTPKAYIAPIDVPNAFALGRGGKACVCVTEGLLSLNKGEIESVVAHETWHIANEDTLVQQVASVTAWIFKSTLILFPLASLVIKMGLSDRREHRADYYAARFSWRPGNLATALGKMSAAARKNPFVSSPAFECLWTVNPFKRGERRWFYTHPPTARRKKRIEDMVHEIMPKMYEGTEDE